MEKTTQEAVGQGRGLRTKTKNQGGDQGGLLGNLMAQEVHPKLRPQGWVIHDDRLTDTGKRRIGLRMTFNKVTQLGQGTETPCPGS